MGIMIPIASPGNFPFILFLVIQLGVPVCLLAFILLTVTDRFPTQKARTWAPLFLAIAFLAINLIIAHDAPTPESPWILLMLIGLLMHSLCILAPFPFFRSYLPSISPYLLLGLAVFVTFAILASTGAIGGEKFYPVGGFDKEWATIQLTLEEFTLASLVYSGALLIGYGKLAGSKNG
jgi:hypothetical protein